MHRSPMPTVLVVDDHPVVRYALRDFLSQLAWVSGTFEAREGGEALRMARTTQPDLILLDVVLPGIDGISVLMRLRQEVPNSRVVVMTGHAEALYVKRARDAGACGFLNKSLDLSAMANCLERVAAGFAVFPITSGGGPRRVSEEEAHQRLTNKELAVLRMLASGSCPKDIAQALSIHTKTVSSYKTRLMSKAHATSLVGLLEFARRCGVTQGT